MSTPPPSTGPHAASRGVRVDRGGAGAAVHPVVSGRPGPPVPTAPLLQEASIPIHHVPTGARRAPLVGVHR